MKEKRYVQHISGQGAKWELVEDRSYDTLWCVKNGESFLPSSLPKSEYVLCDPEPEWEDVTEKCHVEPYENNTGKWIGIWRGCMNVLSVENGYHIRKIDGLHNGPAFIVERRET